MYCGFPIEFVPVVRKLKQLGSLSELGTGKMKYLFFGCDSQYCLKFSVEYQSHNSLIRWSGQD